MTKIQVKQGKEDSVKNIFTSGNLVQLETNDGIVLVTEDSPVNFKSFKGVALQNPLDDLGTYSTDWIKSEFKQFKGTVELTVD